VRSAERTFADDSPELEPEDSDPPAEKPSEDGGARAESSGKGTGYTAEFEGFWEIYPRKVSKKDAFRHWKPKIAKCGYAADIMAAAKAYAAAMKYLDRPPGMILHPDRFITSERWRDWLPPDGREYLDAQETYRRTHRSGQPRAQPPPDPDRYSEYNEVIQDGSDYAGKEDSS
jgi:hypothetical protein